MATGAAKGKNREELDASIEFANAKTTQLYLFKHIGDKITVTVSDARWVPTVIDGVEKKDAKGSPKKHLAILGVDDDDQEWVINLQSENQKEAFTKALENAGYRGVAKGDVFTMEYTHDDAPIQRGNKEMSAARGYACSIS